MIRILLIGSRYLKESPGGAAKSFINIYNGLKKYDDYEVSFLPLHTGKINKFFVYFKAINFLFIPRILRKIRRFKPNLIICQAALGYSSIISAYIKRIPVICLVRDVSYICPKNIDIFKYGNPCTGLESKNICFNCINHWRTLRVFLGDKPKTWMNSLNAVFTLFAIYNSLMHADSIY